MKEQIQYKILLYVFKCLNGQAPSYLMSCLTLYNQPRPGLRSASDKTRLSIPTLNRTALHSAANKAFSLAAHLWNNLPIYIGTADTLSGFK